MASPYNLSSPAQFKVDGTVDILLNNNLSAEKWHLKTTGSDQLVFESTSGGDILMVEKTGETKFSGTMGVAAGTGSFSFQGSPSLTSDLTFVLPPNNGGNGQTLVSDGAGSLTWGNVSTGSAFIPITSIVSTGGPAFNYNVKLGAPTILSGAPGSVTVTANPGSDTITATGYTMKSVRAYIQLQFAPAVSQQRIFLNLNTTGGSGSRGAVAGIPAGTNNWRLTLVAEVAGIPSPNTVDLALTFGAGIVVTLNTGYVYVDFV